MTSSSKNLKEYQYQPSTSSVDEQTWRFHLFKGFFVEVIIIIDVWGTVKIDDHKPIGYEDSRNGL